MVVTTVFDCVLTPIGDGTKGVCPVCDPKGKRPILIEARRNCRDHKNARQQAIERIVEDISDDITENTRTLDEIRQTLEKCFGGCRRMKRYCRKRGRRQLGEQYQAWIEHLLEHDCDPE